MEEDYNCKVNDDLIIPIKMLKLSKGYVPAITVCKERNLLVKYLEDTKQSELIGAIGRSEEPPDYNDFTFLTGGIISVQGTSRKRLTSIYKVVFTAIDLSGHAQTLLTTNDFHIIANGGLTTNGKALALPKVIYHPNTVAISISGTANANSDSTYHYVTSGGVVCAGIGNASLKKKFAASGGITCAGSAPNQKKIIYVASSGVTMNGNANIRSTYRYTSSSGITCAGIMITTIKKIATISGGVTLSGTANIRSTHSYKYIGSSGVTCAGSGLAVYADATFTFQFTNTITKKPKVLGTNMQWVDNGNNLLQSGNLNFESVRLGYVQDIAPTIIRYPGGEESDTYDYTNAVGANVLYGNRQTNVRPDGTSQTMYFGTNEFLNLCDTLSCEPLITVNICSGTSTLAANWVTYVNTDVSGTGVRCDYWEIGNEPYLTHSNPSLDVDAATFVSRFNSYRTAMLAADNTILIGLPLRTQTINGLTITPYSNWSNDVLNGIDDFDFACIHTAYLPFVPASPPSDTDLFGACMASYNVVNADVTTTINNVNTYFPGKNFDIAFTEFNSLFTIGGAIDDYVESLAGAMVVTDLVRTFHENSRVFMANFWSLLGNGIFGAVDDSATRRTNYYVLSELATLFSGTIINNSVSCKNFSNVSVGIVGVFSSPLISGICSKNGNVVHFIILNKSENDLKRVYLTSNDKTTTNVNYCKELYAADYFDTTPISWANGDYEVSNGKVVVEMKPHSIMSVKVDVV